LPTFSVAPQPKAKAPQPSTQAFPTKGNSSKNVKKKEHNVDKREVLQAHAIQVQTLQNELESLKAQLANLKGKSSQPASHAQHVQGSGSREGPPRSFYGLSHDAMVREYVLSRTHNLTHLELLEGPKNASQVENNGKERSWGTLLNSQH
jgi:hypothetical protein